MMDTIGEWIVRTACAQAARWSSEGYKETPVSVNMTIRQFVNPTLPALIKEALEDHALTPAQFQVEVAETAFAQAFESAAQVIRELADIGVCVSIDDFGAGYTTLLHSRGLPIRALKLDRLLTTSLVDDPAAATIVTATIAVAHSLGVEVIAEGIETAEQLRALRTLESHPLSGASACCDFVQGLLFARPLPAERLYDFLARHARVDVSV